MSELQCNQHLKKQHGLSLIELMISIVIGLAVIAGSIQVVANSKRSFLDQDEVKFIQTNARFAIDVITKDLRMAGYLGCTTPGVVQLTNTILDDEGGFVSLDAITGFEGGVNKDAFPAVYKDSAQAGTDSILIRHANTTNEMNVKLHNPSTKTLTVWGNHTYGAGSTLVITDANCRSAGLFHVSGGANTSSIVHNDTSTKSCSGVSVAIKNDGDFNCTTGCVSGVCGLTGGYNPGSKVMELISHAYFIAPSSVAGGIPALKRQVLNVNGAATTATEEVALGVEDLEVVYGYDSDGDGAIDQYKNAAGIGADDWGNVINVKLNLIFRSNNRVLDGEQVLAGVIYTDRYMRQRISTTVRIRNRG